MGFEDSAERKAPHGRCNSGPCPAVQVPMGQLPGHGRVLRGHSLIEILVAVAIILILASLVAMALVKLRRIVVRLGGGAAMAAPPCPVRDA